MLYAPPPPLPSHPPKGVFVTGTDTGIGKTLISAALTRAWHGTYWKPFQTGLAEEPGDTETVQQLTELSQDHILPPAYALQAPLAPAAASALEGITLHPEQLTLPEAPHAPLIIEGAGGLMVPLTKTMLMIDFIAQLGVPVILVTRSNLGTLNHTLLSLEALYQREIPVLGFITNGVESPQNTQILEGISHCRPLLHVSPLTTTPTAATLRHIAAQLPPWEHYWRPKTA